MNPMKRRMVLLLSVLVGIFMSGCSSFTHSDIGGDGLRLVDINRSFPLKQSMSKDEAVAIVGAGLKRAIFDYTWSPEAYADSNGDPNGCGKLARFDEYGYTIQAESITVTGGRHTVTYFTGNRWLPQSHTYTVNEPYKTTDNGIVSVTVKLGAITRIMVYHSNILKWTQVQLFEGNRTVAKLKLPGEFYFNQENGGRTETSEFLSGLLVLCPAVR